MNAHQSSLTPQARSRAGAVLRRVFLSVAIGVASLIAIAVLLWAVLLRTTIPAEPSLSGRIGRGSLEHDGRTRTFLHYIPAGVDPAPALVIVFHGSMGDGEQARVAFGYDFDRLADEHRFIVVYPDGVERHWNDCRKRAPYAARRLGIDDIGFTRALVAHSRAEWNIDHDRVFVTGVSNGGQMAIRLALEAPDLVRAVAPVIASLPAERNMDCQVSGAPVSILFMNGTEDPMNPWEGGDVELYGVWGNRGEVLATSETSEWFARLAGHEGEPERETLPDLNRRDGSTVERVRWRSHGRKSVVLYAIHGGGHTVPHPIARSLRLLGRTNADISAAEEIWSFFSEAP
jgi:polyhydroxybutyrate depolymerase